MSFPTVRLIHDTTGVNEDITNRPIFDLIERTNWLKEQIDSLLIQSSKMFISEAPCSDDCKDSNFVFFDEAVKKWQTGAAGTVEIGGTKEEVPAPGCYIQGMVKNIIGGAGNRKGDIYLHGSIQDFNIIDMMEENEVQIGKPVYLTGKITHSGQGTYTPPSVEIFGGKFVSDTEFILGIDFRNLGERHRHIWFPLEPDKFEVILPAPDGHWLYPYTEFPVWPPISYTSAVMCVNGVAYFHGNYFWLSPDGLHYKHPDYPPDEADPDIFEAILYYQAPWGQELEDELISGAVDSLSARTANLKIYRQGTIDPASSGDLEIANFPIFDLKSTTTWGSEVVKSLNTDTITGDIEVFKGPVVERLYSGTNNVSYTIKDESTPADFGLLDIHVNNIFDFVSSTEEGWEVWKEVNIETGTGDIEIKRGPVLEKLFPKYDTDQNIFLTSHAPCTLDNTGLLDLAIKQVIKNTITTQIGSLVVKGITSTPKGNLDLATGLVVEKLAPKHSKVRIYEQGTWDNATQGDLEISPLSLYRVKFVYHGSIGQGVSGKQLFDLSGFFDNELLIGNGTIIRCIIRQDHIVTQGTIDTEVYITDEVTPRHLTALDLQLSTVVGNNRYADSGEKLVGASGLTFSDKEFLYVKVTTSGDLIVFSSGPDDIPTLEVILFVIPDDH